MLASGRIASANLAVSIIPDRLAAERQPMNCDYQDFEIEPFELGRGLWHARFGRADKQPVVIDGVMFSTLHVGLAWPNPDAAVDDAKAAIDRLTKSIVASGLYPAQA
jgi:hypothetical protein